MAKFRKKPVVIEATQWFKDGDHPDVKQSVTVSHRICEACNNSFNTHGWCSTRKGNSIVCPGDWIIIGVRGDRYPCSSDSFAATYEAVT